jgi:hypothetical protein
MPSQQVELRRSFEKPRRFLRVHPAWRIKQEQTCHQTCQSDEPPKERSELGELQREPQERMLHRKLNQQRLDLPEQQLDRAAHSLSRPQQDNQPSMTQEDVQQIGAKFRSVIRVATMENQIEPSIRQRWQKIQEKPWTA